MNILVYDVAAENGGAISVLEYYYEIHKKDKNNQYYYLLGIHKLQNCDNITVINYPSAKKSWIHRILFDFFIAPNILRQYKIDQVLSLQNTVLPRFDGSQTVYMHNILPFTEYKFSIIEDKKMWVYQNLIGRIIIRSLKKADHIIVQAEWIKTAIEKRIPQCKGKIDVQFPDVVIPGEFKYKRGKNRKFFFPANESKFKNHSVIVGAARLLKQNGINNFEILFTLKGTENQYISKLKEKCIQNELPITWAGLLPKEKVYEEYTKSILVFPSYIETIGLPLYEARIIGTPIIAANCEYAHEVLKAYGDCIYFDWSSPNELSKAMIEKLEHAE